MNRLTRIGELVREVDERNPPSSTTVFSVSERHGVIPQTELFTKQIATTDKSKYRRVEYGDVVFNPYLLWNRAAGVCFARSGGCVSPAYPVLRPMEQGTERFLHYLFRSPALTSAVDAIATGSVTRRRTAPLADILNLAFQLPPSERRQAANRLLSVIDRKIELNQQMNRTLEATAMALFQSWFVDFDPVRAKADGHLPFGLNPKIAKLFPNSFVKCSMGDIPSGWEVTDLGKFAVNHDAKRIPVTESDRKIGSYPYYGASGIVDYISDYLFDGEYLLIAEDGENLRSQKTPFAFRATGKFWVNNHAHVISGTTLAATRFLLFALKRTDIDPFLTGSTMPKLSQRSMNAIPIISPGEKLLEVFGEVTSNIFSHIDLNQQNSETLVTLRDALLPKLLSGELRVPKQTMETKK